ncbi:MAG: translation elongation factor Ts, partial [Nitrospirae bacterium GWD2_57_8]
KGISDLVAGKNPADVAALSKLELDGQGVESRRQALVQKIGENIAVRRFVRYQTDGRLAIYLHGSRIGVMVDYQGGNDQLGKDIAMHIAAANPQFLTRDMVPSDVLARERAVYEGQAKESGKPPAIIPKIVEGKMEKFYGDTCLLEQVYIKDPDGKLKVRDVLKQAGGGASINRFVRYQLGEGIEKKQGNFAEEVAAQLK